MTGSTLFRDTAYVPNDIKAPLGFCPRCVTVTKWTQREETRTCQKCGLQVWRENVKDYKPARCMRPPSKAPGQRRE